MKYNKGFSLMMIIAVVAGIFAMSGTAYLMGRNSNKVDKEVKIKESQLLEEGNTNLISNENIAVDNCSTWLTYNGIYTVKYPNCWTVESIKGGSIGSEGYETGILLKPPKSFSENDSIFIAGWQNTCSNISFSNDKDSMTKAYCLKSENGEKWVGEYITPSNPVNPKNLSYIPVTTRSNNPDVLKMFDLIVSENNK